MLFSLHTLALTNVQWESINVLQRKMLRLIVGWVRMNGEDWSETMRRMNHRISVALELFPIPPWTEQLAKRQFQFAAKVAAEQSWVSNTGHWTITDRWHSNFDIMPSRKTLHNIISHCIMNSLRRLNCHHGTMLGSTSFHILWIFRSIFSPCPYGIVVVVFHFDSGGRRAKKTMSGQPLANTTGTDYSCCWM